MEICFKLLLFRLSQYDHMTKQIFSDKRRNDFHAWLTVDTALWTGKWRKEGQEHLQAECSKTMFISAIIHHLPCHWEFQDYNTLHSGKMSRGRVLGRKCFRLFILNMCSAQHHTELRAWAPGERWVETAVSGNHSLNTYHTN